MSLAAKLAPEPKRRWFQFRLRTLLVLILLASGVFRWVGWELDQRRKEKKTIAWVEGMSGDVYFSGDKYNGCKTGWWITTKNSCFGPRATSIVLRNDLDDLSRLTELDEPRITCLSWYKRERPLATGRTEEPRIIYLP